MYRFGYEVYGFGVYKFYLFIYKNTHTVCDIYKTFSSYINNIIIERTLNALFFFFFFSNEGNEKIFHIYYEKFYSLV